ncbi:MAG: transporter substrate-binding domain-containing protein, partial [Candidatus Methanomethylophilaceae archaeon]|nr:transporter substrate-binding domain-containing protein [Candidatus Methanomethylophilaceae archaeon]
MVGNYYEGIDMDIWRAICKTLDYNLEINYMEFDSIVTAVQGGKFDIGVSGFTITEDRKEKVNFSDVYSTAYQAVVVRQGSAEADYTSYEQLKGKTVGVETGTTGNYMARHLRREPREAFQHLRGRLPVPAPRQDRLRHRGQPRRRLIC